MEKKGIKIYIPKSYVIVTENEDFIWMRKETRKSSLNLMLYTIPIRNDMGLNPNSLAIRDSISKIYVRSYVETSYMQVEEAYLPYVKGKLLDNMVCVVSKGVWDMKNDFMGGPFVNYLVMDEKNKRLIGMDGFLYSPATDKRNIMFQLETILSTFRLK